jgi:hypothetical protein
MKRQGYMLLSLISSLVFRAVRDTLQNDPAAQERIIGASMTALAIADVSYAGQRIIDVLTLQDHTPGNSVCTHISFVLLCTKYILC